jgi:PAS domain-containing protein
MAEIATSTGTRRLLRKAGWPAAVVAASAALGALLLPYANTLVALLLPNALAIALLLTVAVINERRRVEARTRRAEGELRTAESRARTAEACLLDAIDSLDEAFVLFDADDRLVLCNRKFREVYAISADLLQAGTPFEEIIRAGAKRGQ